MLPVDVTFRNLSRHSPIPEMMLNQEANMPEHISNNTMARPSRRFYPHGFYGSSMTSPLVWSSKPPVSQRAMRR